MVRENKWQEISAGPPCMGRTEPEERLPFKFWLSAWFCSIVGIFLLCSSITAVDPNHLMADAHGSRRADMHAEPCLDLGCVGVIAL